MFLHKRCIGVRCRFSLQHIALDLEVGIEFPVRQSQEAYYAPFVMLGNVIYFSSTRTPVPPSCPSSPKVTLQ